MLFPIVAAPVYVPTGSVPGVSSVPILTDICYCVPSEDSHSDRYDVISQCDFFFFLSFVVAVVVVVAISWAAPAAYGGSQARG